MNATSVITYSKEISGIIAIKQTIPALSELYLHQLNYICNGAAFEISLDHRFQGTQEGLSCKSLAHKVVI